MEAYRVMLEGERNAVEINRKAGNKPQVGDVLTGTIEDSEYGYRFKAAPKPFTPSQGKDNSEIKAEWAIGQAIAWLDDKADFSDVEPLARDLFNMVERVKTGELSGFSKAKAVAASLGNKAENIEDEAEYPALGEEQPINLDDIPF